MRTVALISAIAALTIAGMAQAAITIDGTLDTTDYGAAKWVSNAPTSMAGSALNAAYATVQGDNLYVFMGGNVKMDWSQRLNILIDDGQGGQNILSQDGLPSTNRGQYARLTRGLVDQGGLKLDAGFNAAHYFTFGGGVAEQNAYIDYVNIRTGYNTGVGRLNNTVGTGVWAYQGGDGGATMVVNAAFNNDNTVGLGAILPTDAALRDVHTGFEMVIPLASLGSNITELKIAAFVANNNNDVVSNQMIGLPVAFGNGAFRSDGNVGDPWWEFKMNDSYLATDGGLTGPQYISVLVPEPASLGLLGLAGLALAAKRRRAK